MNEQDITLKYSYKGVTEGIIFDLKLQYIKGKWILTGDMGGGCTCSDPIPLSSEIPATNVRSLLLRLQETKIAPLQETEKGIDGGFEEITIQNGWSSSQFSWWDKSNSNFIELRAIARDLQLWAKDSSLRITD